MKKSVKTLFTSAFMLVTAVFTVIAVRAIAEDCQEQAFYTDTVIRCKHIETQCAPKDKQIMVNIGVSGEGQIPFIAEGSAAVEVTFPITVPNGCEPNPSEAEGGCPPKEHHSYSDRSSPDTIKIVKGSCGTYVRRNCRGKLKEFVEVEIPANMAEGIDDLPGENNLGVEKRGSKYYVKLPFEVYECETVDPGANDPCPGENGQSSDYWAPTEGCN